MLFPSHSRPKLLSEHRRYRSNDTPVAAPINLPMEETPIYDEPYVGGHEDALDPIGISFQGDDGTILVRNATPDQFRTTRDYLAREFNAVHLHIAGIWAVVGCKPDLPKGRLPESIGGFIAIWRPINDSYFMPAIGEFGLGEEDMEVEPGFLDGFERGRIPTNDAILRLAHLFPDCKAITFVMDCVIIEFPCMDDNSFCERLRACPEAIERAPFVLAYNNGPLPNTPRHRRAINPEPQVQEDDRVVDDTDYVAKDGMFYPGSMISSSKKAGGNYGCVTAGILLRKGTETRLTCSWHCWEDHDAAYPGLFGQDTDEAKRVFRIIQGEAGTEVGRVVTRVGCTDIALASLHGGIRFENRFLNIPTLAKCLVHSSAIQLNDSFVIDGHTTGAQTLRSLGARWQLEKHNKSEVIPPNDNYSLLPDPNVIYIAAKQGVCGTSDPVLTTRPFIRSSACGSVLVRCRKGQGNLTRKEVLECGEVCGMFHYADLTPKNRTAASDYLIYVDAFDPLIEDGWSVVPVPGQEPMDNIVPGNADPVTNTPRREGLRSGGMSVDRAPSTA
ncbi:hypothetical protein B0T25DRAFT_528550 [Lasiosphaeria hispida]|uniref:Uncharacterized protein n=1 Tax=Lasiosphaeria hispida TaxID=260671 RepID=A0AAJ0HVZ7_9PEZI|nr:hypothetical protein B0T25DRAFT_528550 [Lasiosphaeria hispida]